MAIETYLEMECFPCIFKEDACVLMNWLFYIEEL